MAQPAIGAEELFHCLVKIVIMRELDVTADIPCKAIFVDKRRSQSSRFLRCFYQKPIFSTELIQTVCGTQTCRAAT